MKNIFWILGCVCWNYLLHPTQSLENNVVEDWFTQKLDHCNRNNTKTWKQRYHYEPNFYEDDGPVFIYIGGRNSIEDDEYRYWLFNAMEFKAFFFILEHRFYGKSHPTNDTSIDNLEYLNMKQALSDVAHFITKIRKKFNILSSSKWVTIGGSYGGILSANMRLKYPKLVHAALSSSAPSLLKLQFPERYNFIQKAFENYNPMCVTRVKKAVHDINSLLYTPNGPSIISQQFNLCYPMEQIDEDEIQFFFSHIFNHLLSVVEVNDPTLSVQNVCDIMLNLSLGEPMDRFVAIFTRLKVYKGYRCILSKTYKQTINSYLSSLWDNNLRQEKLKKFQSCTEFGFFDTSGCDTDFFGSVVTFGYQERMCIRSFENKYSRNNLTKSIEKINKLNFKEDQSGIIYVSGTNDPWYPLTYQKNMTGKSNAIAITIGGMGHCDDFRPPKTTDSAELTAGREIIKFYLRELLDIECLFCISSVAKISKQFKNAIAITKKKITYFINCTDDLIHF